MVRICFLNPPIREDDVARHIPYGIAQLAAEADSWGAQVGIEDVNLTRADPEVIRSELKAEVPEFGRWDIIAFSGLITTYGWQKRMLQILRMDHPETLFIAGGGCSSSLQGKFLDWVPELDALAYGEGDVTLIELLEAAQDGELLQPSRLTKIKGIYFREDLERVNRLIEHPKHQHSDWKEMLRSRRVGKTYTRTPPRPLLTPEELGNLPFPAYEMFGLLPTVENGRMVHGYFNHSSLALSAESLAAQRRLDGIWERGCPGHCAFCSHNLMGGDDVASEDQGLYGDRCVKGRLTPLIRYFSPDYVARQVEHMLLKFKLDFIAIMDETLLYNRKRVHEILDIWEAKDLVGCFKWGCLGRPENPDVELMTRMREDGCCYVSYGYESSSQRMLNYLDKGTTPEGQQKTLEATLKAGINPITTYIIGYPGEDCRSLYDSLKFWIKNGIEVTPFFLTPYPYTRVYWECKDKILKQYGGDEEAFVLRCGDATDFIVNLTDTFTDVELLGVREIMRTHDLSRFLEFARQKGQPIEDPDMPRPELTTKAPRETSLGAPK